jgi:Rrf2 family protein
MIYSKPCEYAIRAMAYLARAGGPSRHGLRERSARAKQIARAENLPAPVLGKVLQELVRKGLLESRRGPGGGFRLARRAELITLRDVVAAVDGLDGFLECAVGLERCADDAPCPLHDGWKALRAQMMLYLEGITVAQMAEAVARKRELIRAGGVSKA